ncbi:MAG TPA: RNA 2',3'-cyclic phosphodiesterase [Ignavibacteria bacterium]|nr:RNA 2',3'-cyclic phosphodiesterase [Ignavibacteria bacterium]
MRTFISLNIDISTKNKIKEFKEQIIENIMSSDPEILNYLKCEDEKNYHITIFFIGDTNNVMLNEIESALTEIISDSIPLQIKMKTGKLNAFPNFRYPRVIILDVIDPSNGLKNLSKEINKCMLKFGFKSDKPFHPHITLARVRRDRKINLTSLGNILLTQIEFTTDHFSLMESRLNSSGAEHFSFTRFQYSESLNLY